MNLSSDYAKTDEAVYAEDRTDWWTRYGTLYCIETDLGF